MEFAGLAEERTSALPPALSIQESVASAFPHVSPLPHGGRRWDELLSKFLSDGIIVNLDVIKNMPIHSVIPLHHRHSSDDNLMSDDVLLWRYDALNWAFLDENRAASIVGPRGDAIDMKIEEVESLMTMYPPHLFPPSGLKADDGIRSLRSQSSLPKLPTLPWNFELNCACCQGFMPSAYVENIWTRYDRYQDESSSSIMGGTNSITHVELKDIVTRGVLLDRSSTSSFTVMASHHHFCLSNKPKYVHHISSVPVMPQNLQYSSASLKREVLKLQDGRERAYQLYVPEDISFEHRYSYEMCHQGHYAAFEFLPQYKIILVLEGLNMHDSFRGAIYWLLYKLGFVHPDCEASVLVSANGRKRKTKNIEETWTLLSVPAYHAAIRDVNSVLYRNCSPRPLVQQMERSPSCCAFNAARAVTALWTISDSLFLQGLEEGDFDAALTAATPATLIQSTNDNELITRQDFIRCHGQLFSLVYDSLITRGRKSAPNGTGGDNALELPSSDDEEDVQEAEVEEDDDEDLLAVIEGSDVDDSHNINDGDIINIVHGDGDGDGDSDGHSDGHSDGDGDGDGDGYDPSIAPPPSLVSTAFVLCLRLRAFRT